VFAGRPIEDVFILAFVAIFFLIEAALLVREGHLGWAMFTKCLALATTFGYSLVRFLLPTDLDVLVGRGIRVVLLVVLSWVIFELVCLRRGPQGGC
jgi:hypothetical protein